MPELSIDDLPFIRRVPRDGRSVFLIPYFDHEELDWHLYIPIGKARYGRVAGGTSHKGIYLSTAPQDPSKDLEYFLGTFVTQHFSFQGVTGAFNRITADIHHFASVLEKYHLISLTPKDRRSDFTFLVETEIEYLLFVIRSLYDLLQRLSKNAARLVVDPNAPESRMINQLPDSFADICLQNSEPRSAAEIQSRWNLFPPIAEFYQREALRFSNLRSVRDSVAHHGESLQGVYDLDEGMAVSTREEPWRRFAFCPPTQIRNEHLGPLRGLISELILDALDLPSRFVNAYWSCVATPAAIHPEMKCFLRNPFGHHLLNLPKYVESPWERSE